MIPGALTREEALVRIAEEIEKGGKHLANFDGQVEEARELVRQHFRLRLKHPTRVPSKQMFERLSDSYICGDALSKAFILEGFTAFHDGCSDYREGAMTRFRFNCSLIDHRKMQRLADRQNTHLKIT